MKHSEEYRKVLRSARWRKLRKERFWAAGCRCESCRQAGTEKTLTLHHRTYERLGRELPEDLQLLCSRCHEMADETRAEQSRNRQSSRRWNARMDGWASKVFGDDWEDTQDADYVERRFQDWLDRQW